MKILVVDDESTLRRTIRTALESAGHSVSEAVSQSQAVQQVEAAKPDLVATVQFPSRWRPRPFAGTSAAAPQASALAALLWSRHSDWNASQIRNALQNAARPCSANSPAWETGHGLLRLPSPE